jgi:NitT/TauT family transport system permease protein
MKRASLLLMQIAVAAVIIGFWQLASTTHLVGDPNNLSFFFSTPLAVAGQVWRWFATGTIWHHLWITLSESVLAFAIGSLSAIVIGFWFARKPLLAAVFDPYVKAALVLMVILQVQASVG